MWNFGWILFFVDLGVIDYSDAEVVHSGYGFYIIFTKNITVTA